MPFNPDSIDITIRIDVKTQNLQIEMAGSNGSRQKIPDVLISELPPALRAAIVERQDQIRAQKHRDLIALQNNNINYVVNQRGLGLRNARKWWGKDFVESAIMRKRLHYSSPEAGNIRSDGKLKQAVANAAARPVRVKKPILDL